MTARVNADRARSRTFVVTGAASGIGLATARRLLAEGGTVVGADLAAPPDDLAFRARISGSSRPT
jgi:NAD(P)-dependent dehydrogenase (short-subunit alcohol dehydrogenase family)